MHRRNSFAWMLESNFLLRWLGQTLHIGLLVNKPTVNRNSQVFSSHNFHNRHSPCVVVKFLLKNFPENLKLTGITAVNVPVILPLLVKFNWLISIPAVFRVEGKRLQGSKRALPHHLSVVALPLVFPKLEPTRRLV